MSLFLELLLQVPYHEMPSCVSKLLPISLHLSHTLCTVVWLSGMFVRHDVIVWHDVIVPHRRKKGVREGGEAPVKELVIRRTGSLKRNKK